MVNVVEHGPVCLTGQVCPVGYGSDGELSPLKNVNINNSTLQPLAVW